MKANEMSVEDEEKAAAELEAKRKSALQDAGLDAGELAEGFGVSKDAPHLLNISDDPTMAGLLIFHLKEGENAMGKELAKGGIKINGLGI